MKSKKFKMILVNFITILRLLGAICLPFIYIYARINITSIIAVVLFLTDFVDGRLARKWDVATFFGALLDVICDKLLGISALIILCFVNRIMYIPLLLEGLIVLFNVLKYLEGFDVQTRMLGKTKTWFLSLTIIISFIVLSFTAKQSIIADANQNQIIEIVASTLIISQVFALVDYITSIVKNLELRVKIDIKQSIKSFKEINKMLFDIDFYKKNKGAPIRTLLYTKRN